MDPKPDDDTGETVTPTKPKNDKPKTDDDEISTHLGFCKSNADCETSTYCCSDFSCTDPSICLHGGKQ